MSSSDSGSNGSSGGGNIIPPRVIDNPEKKRASAALTWIFTWNNYPENWKDILVPGFQNNNNVAGYVVAQEVAPTTGTPHLQGYLEFKKKARPMGLLPKQVWWKAARRSADENFAYCTKAIDDIDYNSPRGFLFWGTCKPPKPKYNINIELRPWQRDIHAICQTDPDDRTIHWYWEPTGCKGKTTFQKWIFLNHEGVIVVSGKAADMKNGVIEYEEKHKVLPTIVLINIPRCTDTDHVSWQGIEEIKDMFFFSPKYHGGQVCGPNPHVFIFSNEEPPLHKMSSDRWVVQEIKPEPPVKRLRTSM